MDGNAMRRVCEGLAFAESPRWHGGALWFSDFYTHRVQRLDTASGELRSVCEVPGQPSGLGWLPDGRLLVVSMIERRAAAARADGSSPTHADLSRLARVATATTWSSTPHGRAYVGNFGFDLASPRRRAAPADARAASTRRHGERRGRRAEVPERLASITPDGRTLDRRRDGGAAAHRLRHRSRRQPVAAAASGPSSARCVRTASASTPRARSGAPPCAPTPACACARAARCWRASRPRSRASPARSAATTAARSSSSPGR